MYYLGGMLMDYGLILQNNRNALFRNIADLNQCLIEVHGPVKFMDLRPYIYSSTIFDFDVSYVDTMIKEIHFNRLPSTIFLGDSELNRSKIESLLKRDIAHDKLPIMTVDARSLLTPETTDSNFRVKAVGELGDLNMWCNVITKGLFENESMPLEHMIKLFSHAINDTRYIMMVGFENQVPVSAGIGFLNDVDDQTTVGGIYMIATVKEYRGRGYGATLTYKITKALIEKMAQFVILDASEMGQSIYHRMGYVNKGYSYRFFPNHN